MKKLPAILLFSLVGILLLSCGSSEPTTAPTRTAIPKAYNVTLRATGGKIAAVSYDTPGPGGHHFETVSLPWKTSFTWRPAVQDQGGWVSVTVHEHADSFGSIGCRIDIDGKEMDAASKKVTGSGTVMCKVNATDLD